MKKSIFTRKLQHTGPIRTVTGEIKVTMNYDKKIFDYNNPSTHETEGRLLDVHKIESFIDFKFYKTKDSLVDENSVLKQVEILGNEMIEEMKRLGNTKSEKTFQQKMNDLNFDTL